MSVKSRKLAQARYDAKRPNPIGVRLSHKQIEWLRKRCLPGEGYGTAIKRLAGIPKTNDL